MKALGLKTVILTVLTLIIAPPAFQSGRLELESIIGVSRTLSFGLGLFTVILGLGLVRFLRSEYINRNYLRFTRNPCGDEIELLALGSYLLVKGSDPSVTVLELPGPALRIATLLAALLFSILCFSNRTEYLLRDSIDRFSFQSEYCPDADAKPVVLAAPKLGCELIQRAYSLGLTKNLGDCE